MAKFVEEYLDWSRSNEMPCWHDPLEVDNGLHVGIKNLMKTGVTYTACEKKGVWLLCQDCGGNSGYAD